MLSEDEIRRSPEEEDKWRYEEPGVPAWEQFMKCDTLQGMVGSKEQFTYLILDMQVPEDTYISSTAFVDLDDNE